MIRERPPETTPASLTVAGPFEEGRCFFFTGLLTFVSTAFSTGVNSSPASTLASSSALRSGLAGLLLRELLGAARDRGDLHGPLGW